MIFGIGTDIVSYPRILAMHEHHGNRFARRVLSEQEMGEYIEHPQQARMLMKRFAAKEAFSKAAGTGLRAPVTMQAISVIHDELGKPGFRFSASVQEFLDLHGVRQCHLSISDEREHAVAFVILEM